MSSAGTAAAAAAGALLPQNWQRGGGRQGRPGADVHLSLANALGRMQQFFMRAAARAAFAIAVRGNLHAESHGAQVGHFAQEIHGRFGVALFQFAIRGAHAAERLDAAGVTLGLARFLFGADAAEKLVPASAEAARTPVVAFLMRKHANADLAVGIDGAGGEASAALINIFRSESS